MTLPNSAYGGTPRAQLVQTLCDARRAVLEADKAHAATWPNGRDYETAGQLQDAQREFGSRASRLAEVAQELYALAIAIQRLGQ